jgi:hypothetical protein
MLFRTKKAQGETFNLIVAAVLGLAILVIIVGIVLYFQNQKFLLSQQRFDATFDRALATPTGDVLVEKNVFFKGGELYSGAIFATGHAIGADCVSVQGGNQSALIVTPDYVRIKTPTELDVYYKCTSTPTDPACGVACVVSFGKKP